MSHNLEPQERGLVVAWLAFRILVQAYHSLRSVLLVLLGWRWYQDRHREVLTLRRSQYAWHRTAMRKTYLERERLE